MELQTHDSSGAAKHDTPTTNIPVSIDDPAHRGFSGRENDGGPSGYSGRYKCGSGHGGREYGNMSYGARWYGDKDRYGPKFREDSLNDRNPRGIFEFLWIRTPLINQA